MKKNKQTGCSILLGHLFCIFLAVNIGIGDFSIPRRIMELLVYCLNSNNTLIIRSVKRVGERREMEE